MRIGKRLRCLVLPLVISSLALLASGCDGGGGGGGGKDAGAPIPQNEAGTLDPAKDSTMTGGTDPNAPAIPK